MHVLRGIEKRMVKLTLLDVPRQLKQYVRQNLSTDFTQYVKLVFDNIDESEYIDNILEIFELEEKRSRRWITRYNTVIYVRRRGWKGNG